MLENHRVVIVGGGFGGLYAARSLKNIPVEVTLVDRHNYHLFQPLLYQVATGFLSPADVASPLRAELKSQKNTRVILGQVKDVDVENHKVLLQDGSLPYDTLIMAPGSSHSYFGHSQWGQYAPGIKSVDDALEVCSKVFLAFEMAERATNEIQRRTWLTFVIVGGGPTGVELAGALGETALHTLKTNFRSIHPEEVRILLFEGMDHILPVYPPDLEEKAVVSLQKLGVDVQTGTMVTALNGNSVTVKAGEDEKHISTSTILWAAGVQASPLGKVLHERTGVEMDKKGRLMVEPDLTLKGHPEIFVIGDLANYPYQTGKPLPGVAQPAMQEGAYAARLIQARLEGRSLEQPFHYKDKGNLATIGRMSAVADLGKLKFGGFTAKLLWIFVHLWYITEFENKALVFLQWAWNFLTMSQRARLIVGKIPTVPTQFDAEPHLSKPKLTQVEPIKENGGEKVAH